MDLLVDVNDQLIEKLVGFNFKDKIHLNLNLILFNSLFKGIQLDELQGLRKKTETELKLSTTMLQTTSRNIPTSWNKNVNLI